MDVFEVCDTKADGYGVSGRLTHRNISLGTVEYAFTIDDGGDAGCDKKAYDVKGYPHYYLMKFWWHGGGSALTTEWFRE
ncbi:hypothetical protein [Streptomyces sp. C10-9-1]|uniref:hypothetical protein n=1 Tax=Streptomyces sp. C10-9-1 TaxID=1859285 RepID=UPI003D74AF2B